jgi:hypothetical protein
MEVIAAALEKLGEQFKEEGWGKRNTLLVIERAIYCSVRSRGNSCEAENLLVSVLILSPSGGLLLMYKISPVPP